MSTEPIVHKEKPVQSSINPFARTLDAHVNAGTVAVESERAIAEAQGKLVIAKRFPRDQAKAYSNIIDACKRHGLAEEACYSFPRGGEVVSGPAIRLAEMLAANWGNVDYGIRELSRKEGVSEMEAYCWDLETNTMSSQKFTVRHIRDTRGGGRALTDERDIYELTANMGARRLRARILAILPADLVQAAVDECGRTLAGGNGIPMADRIRKMLTAFKALGVPAPLVEKRLGHPLDNLSGDELADLTKIHNSLRDNMSKLGDWFGDGPQALPDDDVPYTEAPKPEARPTPPPRQRKGAATVAENQAPKTEAPKVEPAPAPEPTPEPTMTQRVDKVLDDADKVALRAEGAREAEAKRRAKMDELSAKLAEEAAANLKAEAAASTPAKAPRAFIKPDEVLEVICTVKDVTPLMLKVDGQDMPSTKFNVTGEYTGLVYHHKAGKINGKNPDGSVKVEPEPIYVPGAVLKLTLIGKHFEKPPARTLAFVTAVSAVGQAGEEF
jgi:hypothetical protein